jgi:oligopeptide transport system substrate-binding protein
LITRIGILAVLTYVVALASCGIIQREDKSDGKTVLRYNESAGISYLDPAFSERFEDIWAMTQLYNGLIQLDNALRVKPAIAKRWELSEDMLEYTFHLRTDVYFHDHEVFPNGKGRKVVADDFVYSFFRILDPETNSQGKYIFTYLDKSEKADNIGFKAVNDSTLKIFLRKPQQSFMQQLSLTYCSVVPHEAVDFYKRDFRKNPIGTGPFQMKAWHESERLVFVKNENYWEKDDDGSVLPYIDAINITFIRERHVEYQKFLKGELEFMSGIDPSFKDELLDGNGELPEKFQKQFYLEKHPWLKTDYIGVLIDEEKKIVKDGALKIKEVRKAINYAINRKELITYLRNGIGRPANAGFIPYGMPAYKDTVIYKYDLRLAKQMLFEAGHDDGQGMPEITLLTTNEYKNICEYLRNNLTQIGLKVNVEIVTSSILKQRVAQHKSDFFKKSWTADFPDAINFLSLFYSENFAPENGPNYTHFSDFYFDKYYRMAQVEPNDEVRYDLYRKMDRIVMESAPIIPLYYDEVIRFVQRNVEGLDNNSMNQLNLKRVKIKK